jgi:hypothetical protein
MKVSVKDLRREHVWKVADIRLIPQGWKKQVFYDPESEELYGVLLIAGEMYVPPAGHVFLYEFVSLEEFWTNFPGTEEDIGVTGEATEEKLAEAIMNAYQEVWWDEFEFPPELL